MRGASAPQRTQRTQTTAMRFSSAFSAVIKKNDYSGEVDR
jgi:hypothetical protein